MGANASLLAPLVVVIVGAAASPEFNAFSAAIQSKKANVVVQDVAPARQNIVIAGYGGNGYSATSAQLNSPSAVTFDTSGNMYIADTGNNRIQKVAAVTNIVTTVAGSVSGASGSTGDGGFATNALLYSAWDIKADVNGNLYFIDAARVRMVTMATGFINTVAGNTTSRISSNSNGMLATWVHTEPELIAVDASGNLFISERNVIRKVTKTTGILSLVAGTVRTINMAAPIQAHPPRALSWLLSWEWPSMRRATCFSPNTARILRFIMISFSS